MGDPIVALLIGGARHRERLTVQSNRANSVPIKLYLDEEVYVRDGPVVAGVAEYKYSHTAEQDKELKYRGKKYMPKRPYQRLPKRVVREDPPPVLGKLTCSSCEAGQPCDGLGL